MGLEGRQRAYALGWVFGLVCCFGFFCFGFFFPREMVRYGQKMAFLWQFSPAETKKKITQGKGARRVGMRPGVRRLSAPRSRLFMGGGGGTHDQTKQQQNEGGGGRNSVAIVAISLPALGARCPVATAFVLWKKGDNSGGRLRAGPLPPPRGTGCAGGAGSVMGCFSPLSSKKRLQAHCAGLKIIRRNKNGRESGRARG